MKKGTRKRLALAEINTNFTPIKKNEIEKATLTPIQFLKIDELKTPVTNNKQQSTNDKDEIIEQLQNLLNEAMSLLHSFKKDGQNKKFFKSVQTQTDQTSNQKITDNKKINIKMNVDNFNPNKKIIKNKENKIARIPIRHSKKIGFKEKSIQIQNQDSDDDITISLDSLNLMDSIEMSKKMSEFQNFIDMIEKKIDYEE